MPCIIANLGVCGFELIDDGPWKIDEKTGIKGAGSCLLALEIEDLDAAGSGSTKPVTVGGEDEGVDDVTSFERVEVLALVEVPEHGDTVLATGGSERTVGGDGDSVDVSSVAVVVGLQLELGEFPDLKIELARVRLSTDDCEGHQRSWWKGSLIELESSLK